MIPKERVSLVIEHKEPDRFPVGELGLDSLITEEALGGKEINSTDVCSDS